MKGREKVTEGLRTMLEMEKRHAQKMRENTEAEEEIARKLILAAMEKASEGMMEMVGKGLECEIWD